jgi:putative protein-disulfide isomerase
VVLGGRGVEPRGEVRPDFRVEIGQPAVDPAQGGGERSASASLLAGRSITGDSRWPSMLNRLYYVHDPMCSWCWGFRPALETLLAGLPPDIEVERLLGGLASDSLEPMPAPMREHLQQTWRRIQDRIPGTRFNFDFWARCSPRRSTWPACRAVIAARRQDTAFDLGMTDAIQRAYYLDARNPSDPQTLIALAGEIGADRTAFARDLDAAGTRQALEQEMERARGMGVDSFPALVLDCFGSRWRIPVEYTDPAAMLETIVLLL